MLKIFDKNKFIIKRLKEDNVSIVKLELDSKLLDLPLVLLNDILAGKIERALAGNDKRYVYFRVDVVGECSKGDIEDFYDYVESAIVKFCCTKEEIEENKERLGLLGLPSINMRSVNLIKWIKFKAIIDGFGLEVGKKDGFWKKRMVK